MDFNVVTLEIADLIVHFDYYDNLVTGVVSKTGNPSEDQTKIQHKSKEHLNQFFADVEFYNRKKQLKSVTEMKDGITANLAGMKTKDIHDLVEKLEKDAKKIKKLYLSLTKK